RTRRQLLRREMRGKAGGDNQGNASISNGSEGCAIAVSLRPLVPLDRLPIWSNTVGFRTPQFGVIYILPVLEPGTAIGEVDRIRRTCLRLLVPAFQPVPRDRDFADFFILGPLHPMKVGAAFTVDQVGSEGSGGGMAAIEKHERRPVLARICGLDLAVHLGRRFWRVVMLDAYHRLAFVAVGQKLGDIRQEEEVTVAKQRPPSKIRQPWSEEARIGKFRGRQRIDAARVDAARNQVVQLYRDDSDPNGRVFEQRPSRNLVGDGLARIPTHINVKRPIHQPCLARLHQGHTFTCRSSTRRSTQWRSSIQGWRFQPSQLKPHRWRLHASAPNSPRTYLMPK